MKGGKVIFTFIMFKEMILLHIHSSAVRFYVILGEKKNTSLLNPLQKFGTFVFYLIASLK